VLQKEKVMNMTKNIVYILGLFSVLSSNFLVQSIERTYIGKPIIFCKDYNEVYDSKGNIKNPQWYMGIEKNLLLNAKNVSTLVGQSDTEFSDVHLQSGVLTIQFSHQIITTPENNNSAQVCRIYYAMKPKQVKFSAKKETVPSIKEQSTQKDTTFSAEEPFTTDDNASQVNEQ
jgi:hypothetical protein